MTTHISDRDWEAISAYLDGELSPQERARLESRLQSEPDIRAALEDMGQMRALLRRQERLGAPRNFTLTEQMVGKRPAGFFTSTQSWFPILRMASALASILLVFVLIGDLLSVSQARYGGPMAPGLYQPRVMRESAKNQSSAPVSAPTEVAAAGQAAATEAQKFALDASAAPTSQAEALPAAPLAAQPVGPPQGKVEGASGAEANQGMVEEALPVPKAGEAFSLPMTTTTLSQTVAVAVTMTEVAPGDTPYPAAAAQVAPEPVGPAGGAPAGELTKEPTEEKERLAQEEPSTLVVPPEELKNGQAEHDTARTSPGYPPLRWLEIILAAVAVGCGLAAWLIQRRISIHG